MNTKYMVETHGDPIGSMQEFLHTIWIQAGLAGMLVPANGSADSLAKPHLIDNPDEFKKVNPFKPLMTLNSARMIPELVRSNPDRKIGAMLRPCEMRALIEMVKHDSFDLDNLLTISVDCLGTLPADEYKWRAERRMAANSLADEALNFARQGGIVAYRYRQACQTCDSPEARNADLNINIFGLPVRQHILVDARTPKIADRLHLSGITAGEAPPTLVEQHIITTEKMKVRHRRTVERVTETLIEYLPEDVDALIAQLEECGSCQLCMDVCPICSINRPERGSNDRYQRIDIIRWLISCAGCGMCEQSCASHKPLNTIFGYIRKQLTEEYGYTPGRSIDDPLPIQ